MKTNEKRPPEGYAGHEPLPTVQGSKPFIDCSEHVEVVYSFVYRCQHCGYVPPEFWCNPKMREHLKEAHGIEEPLDAWWWMSGYHDNRLKRELTELAALRARLAEAEAMNAEFIAAGAKLGIRLAKLEAKPEPPGTPRPVKTVTCPHCSHSQEPPEHEVYYDEDEYPDILCQSCGAYFDAVVEVAISWRTMKRERFNE